MRKFLRISGTIMTTLGIVLAIDQLRRSIQETFADTDKNIRPQSLLGVVYPYDNSDDF